MAQASAHGRLLRRVSAYGPRPGQDGRSALLDVLKAHDLYSGAPVAVAPRRSSGCCRVASWRSPSTTVCRRRGAS
eukprot:5417801-Lingulodinium_polyedra.AAC.1